MAMITRGTNAPKTPAATATSKSKASSRPKASSNAKTATRTNFTPNAARRAAAAPLNNPDAIQGPATPSSGTLTPDRINETDIDAPNDFDVLRRLIQAELAKTRGSQSGSDRADTHRVHKSHSRRRHRRSRRYSSESSTDSEEGDRPRVSFLQQDEAGEPHKAGPRNGRQRDCGSPTGSQRDGTYAAVPGDLWADRIAFFRAVSARPAARVVVVISRSPS